jgi:hypothetical protein
VKFKGIFLIFNIVLLVSVLFIFFLPFFVLGQDYTKLFWSKNWILAVFFVIAVISLNTYFIMNWTFLTCLEKEDWPGLAEYLETKIYKKRRFTKKYIKSLIETYMVSSRVDDITKLETRIRRAKPKIFNAFILQFGIPYLVKSDAIAIETYFAGFKDNESLENIDWIRWNYLFGLMLQERMVEGLQLLADLVSKTKDDVLLLLSLYMLDASSGRNKNLNEIVRGRKRYLKKKYTRINFEKEVEKNRTNLQVLVLSKLINDSMEWLYA